jgi:H+-transporting ATPase
MLTYTLNKIIKTVELAVFLTLGVMLTGEFVVTPLMVLLLLFANDFVTMSIATDRVSFAPTPQRWHIGTLAAVGGALSLPILILSFGVLYAARSLLHLPLAQQQTVVFVLLVAIGQGTVYLVRERGHFWRSRPSTLMLAATAADLVVVGAMATRGVLMAPVSAALLGVVLVITLVWLAAIDWAKVWLFATFRLP